MDALITSLSTALTEVVAFIPTLLGAILILAIGWILAAVLKRATHSALERIGFNRLVQRGRVSEVMQRAGTNYEPATVVASVVFWIVLVATILLAANTLGLVGISTLLTRLVAFLPHVFVAIVVLAVAFALAQIVYEAIVASIGDRIEGANMIAVAAQTGIIVFGVFMALSQLQISPAIVNSLFIITIGAIAAAFAISFGVGNIDLARDVTRKWYNRVSEKTEEVQSEEPRRAA